MEIILAGLRLLMFFSCIGLYIWSSYHREPKPPYEKTPKGKRIDRLILYIFIGYGILTVPYAIHDLIYG